MKKFAFLFLCLGIPFLVAYAAVPSRITYQGRLSKSGVGAAGRHTIFVQFIDKDGNNLPAAQPFEVDVPSSGDFSLDITNIPPDADWINGLPKMRVIVGGETLTPDQSFSATPYALVARNVENLDTSKVKLAGSKTGALLSSWQSAGNEDKIDAKVIVGTVPYVVPDNISPSKIQGIALVSTPSINQTIQPTNNLVPLTLKGHGGSSANLFEVWDYFSVEEKRFQIKASGNAYFNGNVGIGTEDPIDKLDLLGGNLILGSISDLGGNNYGSIKFRTPSGIVSLRSSISGLFGNTGNRRGLALDLQNDDTSTFEIVREGVGPEFGVRATGQVYVGGNLGIGTTSPTSKLEVAGGDLKVGGSITLLNDLRIKREGATPAQYDFQIQPIMSGDNSDLQILPDAPGTGIGIYTRNSAGTAILGLGINRDGNVGINKTAPTKALDVAGDANVTGKMTSSSIGINKPSPDKALDVVGDTNISGKVGINNPTPTKALDVVGDANISGVIRGATFGFGGMYSVGSEAPTNVFNNPLTGGKSCPPGFTPYQVVRLRTAEPERGADVFMCIK